MHSGATTQLACFDDRLKSSLFDKTDLRIFTSAREHCTEKAPEQKIHCRYSIYSWIMRQTVIIKLFSVAHSKLITLQLFR